MSSSSPFAFNKDAFPNRRLFLAGRTKSFACQNQPDNLARPSLVKTGPAWAGPVQRLRVTVSCVNLQAQYRAFVRFAVESGTASAIALDWTCVLEPFTRRALVSRTLAPTRYYGGSNPGPMLWSERSRSRGIFQGVFLRSNWTLSGHFAAGDRPFDAGQIGSGGACRR